VPGQGVVSPKVQNLAASLAPQPSYTPQTPPPAVAAPAANGGGDAGPQAPTPFDSQWTTGVAGLFFRNKNQRDDLSKQGEQATQDFNTMLSRMAESRANDLLAQNYAANQQGLFYSGQLGKRRGQVEQGYGQREQDARTDFNRAAEARAAALDRLGTVVADPNSPTGYSATGQAGLDLSDLFNQAIFRRDAANVGAGDLAAAQELASPDVQQDVAEAMPIADTAPTFTSSGPQQTTGGVAIKIAPSASHGGAKWVYHRAASGQWIPIRPA
jgi:hypothetical protein